MSRIVRYYSVESRKGGVGKTTAALNLAKILQKRGQVVLLDCDITGTSISGSVRNSPYWNNITNVVGIYGHEPANLLTLFNDYCTSDEANNVLTSIVKSFVPNKINILGSELYDKCQLVADPRQIMDDLHSYWLLDLLKHVTEMSFSDADTEVSVVIDNSPGYVGLGRSIHEWLTGLGTNFAHFLLVSSLDEQDLESSLSSALEIERLMEGKIRAKNYFVDLLNGSDIVEDEEKYLSSCDSEIKRYFYSLSDRKKDDLHKEEIPDITKYISIIFNKVADECIDDCTTYDASYLNPEERRIYEKLVRCNQAGFPLPVIPYDTQINTQFFEKHLSNNNKVDPDYWHIIIDGLLKVNDNPRYGSDVVKKAYDLNNKINNLRDELSGHGYKTLSKDIRNEWLTVFSWNDLRRIVSEIIYYKWTDFSSLHSGQNKDMMMRVALDNADDFCVRNNLMEYSSLMSSLTQFLFTAVKTRNGRVKLQQSTTILVFLSAFFSVLGKRYSELPSNTFRDFLIREYLDKNKTISLSDESAELYLVFVDVNKTDYVKFQDYSKVLSQYGDSFYRGMIYCMLRMLDIDDDYTALIVVLYNQVLNMQSRFIPSEIKKYLDEVIELKNRQYDSVALKKLYSTSMSMLVFEKVLNDYVTKPWNL